MFIFSCFMSHSSPIFFFATVKKFLVRGGKLFFLFSASLTVGSLFTFASLSYLMPYEFWLEELLSREWLIDLILSLFRVIGLVTSYPSTIFLKVELNGPSGIFPAGDSSGLSVIGIGGSEPDLGFDIRCSGFEKGSTIVLSVDSGNFFISSTLGMTPPSKKVKSSLLLFCLEQVS